MDNTSVPINRVAQSGLVTLDLATYYPQVPLRVFDLKDFLVQGLVLMEKPFREALGQHNWQQYRDTAVGIYCSTDALIPLWAYMLVSNYLNGIAHSVHYGNEQAVLAQLMLDNLRKLDVSKFQDAKVVIKGCGDKSIPEAAYIAITDILKPVVRSLMYGEPCSTVPVYKRSSLNQQNNGPQ
ncbi:MAG: DUF2480 family protein [Chitinophagales bacterium]|nr:DUF2480 family protein [Chitinophagales bacterium]